MPTGMARRKRQTWPTLAGIAGARARVGSNVEMGNVRLLWKVTRQFSKAVVWSGMSANSSAVEVLVPKATVFRSGDFRMWLGHEDCNFISRSTTDGFMICMAHWEVTETLEVGLVGEKGSLGVVCLRGLVSCPFLSLSASQPSQDEQLCSALLSPWCSASLQVQKLWCQLLMDENLWNCEPK